MSYVPRHYPEIVRDLLTVLTKGTVGETLPAPPEGEAVVPTKLAERPVRRISHLQGEVPNPAFEGADPAAPDAPPATLPYRFTSADFELVRSGNPADGADQIRFREDGRRPAPGTALVVNYYPVDAPPALITDVTVGSVARTMLETVARELAVAYLHLEHVYRSAFLDTAEGSSLDKVVALVGVERLRPGRPTVTLRLTRQPGAAGQITVPANTAVTDADGTRYLLQRAVTLEPSEASRDVEARGATAATALAEAGALTRLETLVAGLGAVTNPEEAVRRAAPETDDALRRRAATALQGSARGTLAALEDGLRAVEGVKSVTVVEAPEGVPGEIRVDVAFTGSPAPEDVRPVLLRRVRELRPAGVRVTGVGEAARRRVVVRAALTLAGEGVPEAERPALLAEARARLEGHLAGVAPGGPGGTPLRPAPMTAALLRDARVVDAAVTLVEGGVEVGAVTLAEGEVLDVEELVVTAAPEVGAPALAGTAQVFIELPTILESGVTLAEAEGSLTRAVDGFLATRDAQTPITVDALRAHLRDDARFALVADDVLVTVERADRTFRQLSAEGGAYELAPGERLEVGALRVYEPPV